MKTMKTSPEGIALIKEFEGLRLTAYRCSAHVWTIGYGHTLNVKEGDTLTEQEAGRLLAVDILSCEQAVSDAVSVVLLQHQFDALVSFVFNLGAGSLRRSTLLRVLNAGHYSGASEEFLRWTYAGGVKLPGLVRRRQAEKALFDKKR